MDNLNTFCLFQQTILLHLLLSRFHERSGPSVAAAPPAVLAVVLSAEVYAGRVLPVLQPAHSPHQLVGESSAAEPPACPLRPAAALIYVFTLSLSNPGAQPFHMYLTSSNYPRRLKLSQLVHRCTELQHMWMFSQC